MIGQYPERLKNRLRSNKRCRYWVRFFEIQQRTFYGIVCIGCVLFTYHIIAGFLCLFIAATLMKFPLIDLYE